ncbi:hypothetical protein C8Q77DRAFT_1070201 [Trametes polyzona]|nr:hypothetical protein C8Q77DRAFT_1070201 [Trametes polyzona]
MAASSNSWAAVGDTVNALTLTNMAIAIVSAGVSSVGTYSITRGAGGYAARSSQLESIVQSWDDFLKHISPATAARIDAENGAGSVAAMRVRLRNVKIAVGRLKRLLQDASFWEKVSWGKNALSQQLEYTQEVVSVIDNQLRASTDGIMRELMQSMLAEARQSAQPLSPASGAIPMDTHQPTRPPPVHQGAPALPVDSAVLPHHYPPQVPVPQDTQGMFNELVRFTLGAATSPPSNFYLDA